MILEKKSTLRTKISMALLLPALAHFTKTPFSLQNDSLSLYVCPTKLHSLQYLSILSELFPLLAATKNFKWYF